MRKIGLIVLLICVAIVGCSWKAGTSEQEEVERQVKNFFDGYQKKENTIFQMLVGEAEQNTLSYDGVSGYFADELEYSIQSYKKIDEANFSVDVEVNTIDFEKLFTSSFEETVEKYGEDKVEDHFVNEMEEKIKNNDCGIKTIDCTVTVRKIDGEYKIQMDHSLANALTGGMNEYLYSLREDI